MGAFFTNVAKYGWPALVFAWRNRAELVALAKAVGGLYTTFTKWRERTSRDDKIDKAFETKNPDDLEKSLRTGGGGA